MAAQSLGGKSTLAVALQQMGLPILCDGLARLSIDAHGKIMVHAECAHPSLWPTAIEALNLPDQLGDQLRIGIAKRRLAIPILTSSAPMPLAAVIVLAASRPSHPPGIEPIPLIDRVQLIRDFAAWPSMIATLRQTQTYLLAGAAAAQVPWAYFMRTDPLACLTNDVDQVMHHLATIEPQA